MIRSSVISSFVLSLVLAGGVISSSGCDKSPPGTTPPGDDSEQSADTKGKKDKKDKSDKKDKGDQEPQDSAEDPTKKVCAAETADFPEPYFDETVLIRLPKGVTSDNFVEDNPAFARLIVQEVESVSCVEDVPGGVISFMALAKFQDDKAKDLKTFRDEALKGFAYDGVSISEEKMDASTRFYQAVVDAPPSEGSPEPARALIQMASHGGMMYIIVFETHPNAWNALKETFYASAKISFL